MALYAANLSSLPHELLLEIVGYLDLTKDVNSLCRLTRSFHAIFLPIVFQRHLTWAGNCAGDGRLQAALFEIFLSSVRHNSSNLIQQLIAYAGLLDFGGVMPGTYFQSNSITFFHFATVMDAPFVAGHLMKHGSDITQEMGEHPDLTSLFFALGRYRLSSQKELDAALRIACHYALPKTTRFLLTRGSDVHAVSKYGVSAIHTTVTKRARWRHFDKFHTFLFPAIRSDYPQSLVAQTVATLLDYGADVQRKTSTTRSHICNHKCWKSVSCGHKGQTALHLASSSGMVNVAKILLEYGSTLDAQNDDGYSPLFGALAQGHEELSRFFLQQYESINPFVNKFCKSTALHIACRFALSKIVLELLENKAEVNSIDSLGKTSLHEVLSQDLFDREDETVKTLRYLANFEADPDIITGNAQTPRQMAEKHPFQGVREMFEPIDGNECIDHAAVWTELKHATRQAMPTGQFWGDERIMIDKRRAQELARFHRQLETRPQITEKNFPALDGKFDKQDAPIPISKRLENRDHDVTSKNRSGMKASKAEIIRITSKASMKTLAGPVAPMSLSLLTARGQVPSFANVVKSTPRSTKQPMPPAKAPEVATASKEEEKMAGKRQRRKKWKRLEI